MNINEIHESLIEIDGIVRIESGPPLKTAVATAELLADTVTATHYAVGKVDALGNTIQLGQEMTYADWLGAYVWKIYRLTEVTDEDGTREVWSYVAEYASKTVALAQATALALEA